MTKQIRLTRKLFLNTLPKLKKYHPVITRNGLIRLGRKTKGYTMCPLTAYRKELTGVAGDMGQVLGYFKEELADQIVDAADYNFENNKLRKQIIKLLGL